jgi:hypothetical protein
MAFTSGAHLRMRTRLAGNRFQRMPWWKHGPHPWGHDLPEVAANVAGFWRRRAICGRNGRPSNMLRKTQFFWRKVLDRHSPSGILKATLGECGLAGAASGRCGGRAAFEGGAAHDGGVRFGGRRAAGCGRAALFGWAAGAGGGVGRRWRACGRGRDVCAAHFRPPPPDIRRLG